MQTPAPLSTLLAAHGLDPAAILVHRNRLDPRDASEAFRTIADLAGSGHDLVYERMQDGPVFGAEARVLSMRDEGAHTRLAAFRRLVARRAGNAPGDIVYDYDVAHLLHDFISRADSPTFYDAFESEGLDDLIGRMVLTWPDGAESVLPADDPRLLAVVS